MWVQCLDWEDPLEKEMATPVFFPGESHGQRSLVGYSSQGRKELDMTEVTQHARMQKETEGTAETQELSKHCSQWSIQTASRPLEQLQHHE